MSWLEILGLTVASLFFITGFVGSVVPVMPGAPLIWLGMLLYGLIAGFEDLGWFFFLAQAAMALAVIGVDYLTSALGSHYFGGSKAGIWGSVLGLFVGLFFFPAGLLLGPFLGALLFELLFSRQTRQAFRSGLGATVGFWAALPVKFAIELFMIAWFFIKVLS